MKKVLSVFLIIVMIVLCAACSRSGSEIGNIEKMIYTGAMPDMTREEISSKYSGSQYSISKKSQYSDDIIVSPVKNPKEFSYFGFPVDEIEISYNSEGIVHKVEGRVDLSFERDIGSVVKGIYEQLIKYGTMQYKNSDTYNTEYTFTIDDTEYAIYVYIYENPSARSRQYMRVAVVRADSGAFGMKAP